MSPELIAILSAFVTLGFGIVGGFAWMLHQMDARFDKVDERFDKVDERFAEMSRDVTDLKVAVARLEGGRPQLLTGR
ncbi:hypothetical protein [uncultured Microbacterium sp.]|uniref:hypothetical protein n=1 Tax=uncultured Microbacterium sp. TaxID=191216 RepID=UPI002622E84F|nr:hypothetical protein [uncultured Microbacterium sp.]